MKLMNTCRKYGQKMALAATTVALPALAMANDADLLGEASSQIGALKSGIISFGVIVIGISIALATISVAKRAINRA